jgi:hypothetical protein
MRVHEASANSRTVLSPEGNQRLELPVRRQAWPLEAPLPDIGGAMIGALVLQHRHSTVCSATAYPCCFA